MCKYYCFETIIYHVNGTFQIRSIPHWGQFVLSSLQRGAEAVQMSKGGRWNVDLNLSIELKDQDKVM